MVEQLIQAGRKFTLVEPFTDFTFLKTLDAAKNRASDGSYPLLVSVDFGMRGVDFRAF
jgi:hypothetical protein